MSVCRPVREHSGSTEFTAASSAAASRNCGLTILARTNACRRSSYSGRVEYPRVERAHIVPRFYLRRFAVEDQLAVHLVEQERQVVLSTKGVALRNQAYRRTRPDGTTIDDIEWSLAQMEGVVAPILRKVEESWPLPLAAKAKLAEFIAFQAVRGPRWRVWHDDFTKDAMAKQRRDPVHELDSGLLVPLSERQLDEMEEQLLSDTGRLTRMMGVANKLITIFGSMRWDLLLFDDDLLLLSDHPVVEWPIGIKARRPGRIPSGHGMLNLFEARVPLSPRSALLLTWKDSADGAEPMAGTADEAANINALSIEQAEKQWMHPPNASPVVGAGILAPLASMRFPGYIQLVIESSSVRAEAGRRVNARLGEDHREEAEIVSIRRT